MATALMVSYFVSFVMHICGAKFQEHCFNSSVRDIVLFSILPFLYCKSYDVITDLICIIEKCQYLCNEKGYFKKKNATLQNKREIFFMSYTL